MQAFLPLCPLALAPVTDQQRLMFRTFKGIKLPELPRALEALMQQRHIEMVQLTPGRLRPMLELLLFTLIRFPTPPRLRRSMIIRILIRQPSRMELLLLARTHILTRHMAAKAILILLLNQLAQAKQPQQPDRFAHRLDIPTQTQPFPQILIAIASLLQVGLPTHRISTAPCSA
jgi:hypothetical protein